MTMFLYARMLIEEGQSECKQLFVCQCRGATWQDCAQVHCRIPGLSDLSGGNDEAVGAVDPDSHNVQVIIREHDGSG